MAGMSPTFEPTPEKRWLLNELPYARAAQANLGGVRPKPNERRRCAER
jgi:hypothetical protein